MFASYPKSSAFEGTRTTLIGERYVAVAWKKNKEIGDMLTIDEYQSL
jgi:hypothetical protein